MAASRGVPDAVPVTALQRLIRNQREERGLSQADVAERSKDESGRARVNRQRVHQLEKYPIKRSPSPRTTEGLAAGLGVPLSTIKDAISESLNLLVIRDASDPDLTVYIDEIDSLDPVTRQRYLRMARAALAEFKR
jgi:transcriptional regulator with XRE-family HTH domain